MKKILFVCTGNTCRSPMAEEIFNKTAKEKNLPFEASSAGLFTRTGLSMSENSQEALAQMGIEASDFRSTSITDLDTEVFDLIVTMTPEHRDVLEGVFGVSPQKVMVLCEGTGGVADPYGGSPARYLQCRDEIREGIDNLLERLVENEN